MHDNRPQDSGVDGGIFLQAGIHAARWIEHGLGLRILDVRKVTSYTDSGMESAVSAVMRLDHGVHGVLVVNSLNPHGFPRWGNDSLRVWGTRGFVEVTDGGADSRLYVEDRNHGPLQPPASQLNWFDAVVAEILNQTPMPLSLEQEVRPLRALLRAENFKPTA